MRRRLVTLATTISLVGCAQANTEVDADGTPVADAGVDAASADTTVADASAGRDTGTDAGVVPADAQVIVNEVAAAGDPVDWFELVNVGAETVDLTTWSFSDDAAGAPQKAFFEAGTTIAPGEYLVVEVTDEWPGFKLGGDEELGLFDGDGVLVDLADWDEGQSPDGGSFGRIPDRAGPFATLATPTPGAPNVDGGGGGPCGDGTVAGTETCDDGNARAGDGCSAQCLTEPGFTCVGAPSVCTTRCGDGVRAGDEACDDGNTDDGDGCSSECQISVADPVCGNGVIEGDEQCDDGNTELGDGCDTACELEGPNPCGNGLIDGAERCDDGNTDDGDGCDERCDVEPDTLALVINEVVADSSLSDDWVELHNPNAFAVRVTGWGFTDDAGLPDGDPERPFVLGEGSVVQPGGYLVFERNAPDGFLFGLARGGDSVTLIDADGVEVDATTWTDGEAEDGTSWGRTPNGIGAFSTLASPTRGAPNP